MTLTYFLHRPCIYCSALLLILFLTSCNWSDRCFFDLGGDWLSPRFNPDVLTTTTFPSNSTTSNSSNGSITALAEYAVETAGVTTKIIASSVAGEAGKLLSSSSVSSRNDGEWIGLGAGWLRSLLGWNEWTVPCVNVKVRL